MAQFVLINKLGTRRAGEIIDTVQDPGAVQQLAAFGGVLIPLPSATLQPYIEAAQLAYDRADTDEAQDIMMAGYASSTSIAGGGTAGFVPIWTAGAVLGDSVIKQAGSLVGINVAAPTAALSLPGGVAGAASLNVASGVAPAAPNSGDLWFDGTYLYLRASGINQPLNAPFGTGTPNVLTKWSSVSGLTDTAITEASGAIRTIGITNAGAGATNGTYSQQALTNITGTGTGATADIVVSGNVVTSLVLRSPGTGYAPGDTLSCATIGGGGFVFTVSAVSASDNASGNVTALRVGAGTATPRASIDLASGMFYVTSQERVSQPAATTAGNFISRVSSVSAQPVEQMAAGSPQSIATFYATPQIDVSLVANASVLVGFQSVPSYTGSLAGQSLQPIAFYGLVYRAKPNDVSTGTTTLRGAFMQLGVFTGVGAASTTTLTSFESQPAMTAVGHTIGTLNNFLATSWSFNVASTIGEYSGFRQQGPTGTGTITTFYGLRLEATSGPTITNRWGISQEDALAKSRHYGNFGVGNALDVGAGKVIASLTLTNAGAGATNGTYSQVALTGGSGTGATADIVVAGNVVTSLVLRNPGQGYVVGDTLSTAAVGGSGFVFTVATTASILRSDGTAVAARVGAGTTTPTSAMTVNGMVTLNGAELVSIVQGGTFSNFTVQTAMVLNNGAAPTVMTSNALNYYSAYLNPLLDASALTNNYTVWGVASRPTLVTGVSGATTVSLVGGNFGGQVNAPTMTGKTVAVTGIALFPGVGLVGAGNTISSVTGANLAPGVTATNATPVTVFRETWTRSSFSGAAHTVTDYYAIKMDGPTLSGGATITNRWAIAQDDALAKSRFYGNVGVGNALDVGAGKVIASLTLTNAGTGYTNGTYSQVALTTSTGSGSGATADIVVAGNVVTTVVLRNPGQGYAVGDTLSCASIGAGSNFLLTVATTASILRSDGTVVAPRIGAGTTTPRAEIDIPNGLVFATGTGTVAILPSPLSTAPFIARSAFLSAGTISYSSLNELTAPFYANNFFDITAVASGTPVPTSLRGSARVSASNAGQSFILNGVSVSATRNEAADLSTTAQLIGVQGNATVSSGVGSATTSSAWSFNALCQNNAAGHTITTGYCFHAQTSATGNFTTLAMFRAAGTVGAGTITNFYGVRLEATTAPTITNRWGVSQEDTASKNQFLGNVGVGVDPGAGKVIASLTLTNGGTGYTNGTYSQVALTNITGTGTGATADIVVAGGIVTTVVLRSPGQGYVVGNTLSSASIGAGSNFVLTVATVASTIQADGEVIAPRIGAGTTTPRASLDVLTGAWMNGVSEANVPSTYSQTTGLLSLLRNWAILRVGTETLDATPVGTNFLYCIDAKPQITNLSGSFNGIQIVPSTVSTSGSNTVTGYVYRHLRATPGDLGTLTATGYTCLLQAFTGVASAPSYAYTSVTGFQFAHNFGAAGTTGTATAFNALGFTISAAHVITTAYGLRLQAATISGGASITNYYPIAQEDTLGTNFVRAKTHFGAAVGTAAATNASIEVTAQGTLNGDIRLNSANAVVDVSAASTNGVKFNNRGGAGITGTTQFWYEEGTYTPTLSAGWTATAGNFAGYWTRNGRLVTLTIQFTGGTNSGATGGSTISTPVGLTPTRNGAGTAVNANGTALGNGVVVVTTAGTIINANAITTTTVDKTIVVQYEV